MTNKTVLIGLDGATFSTLNPIMAEGLMPFLKQFIASGTSGILPSVIPPLTPPAWTSIMTGRSPGNHGIFEFVRFESPDSKYLRFNDSRNINCETIWSIVSRHGLSATSLNFPMMVPSRPISGYIVPGWLASPRHMRFGCYPSDLYDTLKTLPFFDAKELAIDLDIERAALNGCPEEEWEEWIELHIRREKQWFEIFHHMMTEKPCDITAIIFDGIDRMQHLFWKFIHPDYLPEELSPWEQKSRNRCMDYFSLLDGLIAKAVTLAGPDARIFMVSDHGFSTSVEIFYLNAWLHQNGYLQWLDEVPETSNELGIEMLYLRLLDLSRTTAYAMTPISNGIYISVAGQRGEEGIPPENYQSFRQKLIDKLRQFVNPATGKPVITDIWTKEEIYDGSQMHLAPDITLALRDNGFVSTLKSDVLVKPRPEPVGTHHPDGIFIAGGSGIRKGVSVEGLSILDVTPVLLHSLGIAIPEDLEGRVPTELFEHDFIKAHPISIGGATIPPEGFSRSSESKGKDQQKKQSKDEQSELSKDEQAKVMQRLKALGYVD